jgi:signal transduction histidine kinase
MWGKVCVVFNSFSKLAMRQKLSAWCASPWRLGVSLAIILSALTFLLFSVPMVQTDARGVLELNQAEFVVRDSATPPDASSPDWHPLTLPDLWTARGLYEQGGWYRLHVHLDAPPPELWGIYLFRIHLNAGVYLNGQYLGDGGRFTEPMARNWNTPLYFTVPPGLWKTGDNEILVRLRTDVGYGMLAPLHVGAEAILKPRFELRRFMQNDISAYMAVALVLVGALLFGLWVRRKQDSLYLWFSASSFCWVIFSSTLFVRDQPLPNTLFLWLIHTALDFWMVFLVGFVHRYLGISHLRRERFYIAAQMSLAVAALVLPLLVAYSFTLAAHTLTLMALFYLAFISWQRNFAQPKPEYLLISVGLSGLFIAGLHDFLMERPLPNLQSWEMMIEVWRHQIHLLYLAVPTLLIFLAWHLTGRFIRALNEAEKLNLNLAGMVKEAHQQLSDDFEKRRVLERNQAAAEAREVVFRDLHDDLGAKLLTLAIGAETPVRADIARSALQDLRDVVSRSTQEAIELSFLLASWRDEMEARLMAAGVKLDWRQSESLPDPVVSHSTALHLGRILRESVSNVLRHAYAKNLRVEIKHRDQDFVVSLEDDGKGLAVQSTQGGRGMSNMRSRVRNVGGEISWGLGSLGGCRVTMGMPLVNLGVVGAQETLI